MATQKRQKRKSKNDIFTPEFEELVLGPMAKQMAGKPLSEGFEKGAPLNTLIGRLVEMALKEEMEDHLGYAPNERKSQKAEEDVELINSRNGYSSKRLKTSQGPVDVNIPRDRNAEFEPKIVPKYKGISHELETRIISMYTLGMTTRDIQRHVEEIYGLETSPMLVSRVSEKLEEELTQWRNRPLEAVYPIVFVDAMHMPIRHGGRVHSTAIYNVSTYNEKGRMEIIGLYIAEDEDGRQESSSYWHRIFVELQKRGLQDILILCSDGLKGMRQAAEAVFPKVRMQPCVVHLIRASTRLLNYKDRSKVCKVLKQIYDAPSYEMAELALKQLDEEWGQKYPAITIQWQNNLPKIKDLWSYGEHLRKMVYTTNSIENIHRRVRKVTKNRSSMPNVDSTLRLVSLILRDLNTREEEKARSRNYWREILNELHIHFADRLPHEWGHRIAAWRID